MMVHRAECECGNELDYIKKDKKVLCFFCGSIMEDTGVVGCVTGVGDKENDD